MWFSRCTILQHIACTTALLRDARILFFLCFGLGPIFRVAVVVEGLDEDPVVQVGIKSVQSKVLVKHYVLMRNDRY
jgi:hypothetical protein